MHMLVLVLNDVNKLDDILMEFTNSNINGATVLDSSGMAKVLSEHQNEVPIFGSLKMLLNENRPFSKTIFTILKDNQIPTAVNCIKKVIGDLSKPGVGIVFTVPINYVEGLTT